MGRTRKIPSAFPGVKKKKIVDKGEHIPNKEEFVVARKMERGSVRGNSPWQIWKTGGAAWGRKDEGKVERELGGVPVVYQVGSRTGGGKQKKSGK